MTEGKEEICICAMRLPFDYGPLILQTCFSCVLGSILEKESGQEKEIENQRCGGIGKWKENKIQFTPDKRQEERKNREYEK